MTNYVRSAASGKFNCYFESCDGSFTELDTLNSHLRVVHGLSIVKNAGKRSKMDLMFLEQMKQQRMVEQGESTPNNTVTTHTQEEHRYSQTRTGGANSSAASTTTREGTKSVDESTY